MSKLNIIINDDSTRITGICSPEDIDKAINSLIILQIDTLSGEDDTYHDTLQWVSDMMLSFHHVAMNHLLSKEKEKLKL